MRHSGSEQITGFKELLIAGLRACRVLRLEWLRRFLPAGVCYVEGRTGARMGGFKVTLPLLQLPLQQTAGWELTSPTLLLCCCEGKMAEPWQVKCVPFGFPPSLQLGSATGEFALSIPVA